MSNHDDDKDSKSDGHEDRKSHKDKDSKSDEDEDAGVDDNEDAGTDEDAGSEPEPDAIEVEGRWHSNFTGTEVIDSHAFQAWGSASAIVEYDNATNSMITQNPADASYSPSKFNKIVWTEIALGSFYYCTVDYSLDTADAARNTSMTADASDPATGGCGFSSWTKLSPVIAVEGNWIDGVTPVAIDSDAWAALTIASYDASSAIVQSAISGMDPVKYSKVVWTALNETGFQLCWVSTDETSALDATTNAGTALPSDLLTGCLGAAWTQLDAP